jgi:hypothetical protein
MILTFKDDSGHCQIRTFLMNLCMKQSEILCFVFNWCNKELASFNLNRVLVFPPHGLFPLERVLWD